jgi:ubiquinone/menaquinone biosynthesis C-methylase UbiE
MVRKAKRRLEKLSILKKADLFRGDASKLPFENNTFDAVFISFTLELFDTPEIPQVLGEIKRVIKPDGRLGVISLPKQPSLVIKLYEWVHHKWPKYIDCRPIYLAANIKEAGFKILIHKRVRLAILPAEIVTAAKQL